MHRHHAVFPREVPPTACLPLQWSDFLGTHSSLESGLAAYLGVPDVQIECSGTASLVVALETLKRRSARRTVVIPAYTCPLVPLAIHHCGLQIALRDLDADDLPDDTLCVIPTHLGGGATDISPTLEAAKQCGAFVVEDAAQSLGATWKGRQVGTLGDIGFYSLALGKGLTIYEGGVLVARDPDMRNALRTTSRDLVPRQVGMEWLRLAQLAGYRCAYNPFALRFVYGMGLRHWLKRGRPERAVGDEFSADIPLHRVSGYRKKIGAAALPRLKEWTAQNAARAKRRVAALKRIDGITVVQDRPDVEGTWPFILVLFRDAKACEAALGELWTAGVGVSRLFIHELQGYDYLKSIVPSSPATPRAKSFADRHLTISNSPWLDDDHFSDVLSKIESSLRLSS